MKKELATSKKPKEERIPRFYLCINRLKPGDVLLTHGGESDSKIIARLACGEYSHAALIFGELIYESDGENRIGYKVLRSPGWAEINGEQVMLGVVPGNPTTCCVLRHRDIDLVEEAKLQQALDALCIETQGRDYSYYSELVPMVRLWPRIMKPIASLYARWKDARRSRTGFYLPGAFCSKVVVSFFEKLGLDMGGSDKNLTAPHDLAHPRLKFDMIESLVVKSADVGEIRKSEIFLETQNGTESVEAMTERNIKSMAEFSHAGQLILEVRSKLNRLVRLQEYARAQLKKSTGRQPEDPGNAKTG